MLSIGFVIGAVLDIVTTERAEFLIVQDDSNPKYPNQVACEFFGDKNTAKLDGVNKGDVVRVDGQIKSREYNGKWFTNFSAFAVRTLTRGSRPPSRGRQDPSPRPPEEELPF